MLIQPISRPYQVGSVRRRFVSWTASSGRAVGWGTLRRSSRRLKWTWRIFYSFLWRGGCNDRAQLHTPVPSRRFASTLRRSGGLRRPGVRMEASLTLLESAVLHLAVGGFLSHNAFGDQLGGGGLYQYSPPPDPGSRCGLY